MAAAQVVGHLPPARLAGALVGGRGDAADEQLVGRLQWVQVRTVAEGEAFARHIPRGAGTNRGWAGKCLFVHACRSQPTPCAPSRPLRAAGAFWRRWPALPQGALRACSRVCPPHPPQEWAAQEAASDPDEHCRLLAAGCAALQAQLASEALAAAERLPDADALDPSRLLARGAGRGGGGAGSGAPGGLSVRAPELGQRLRLV